MFLFSGTKLRTQENRHTLSLPSASIAYQSYLMASFEFDTVKADKADAITRYKRNRIFTLCLHFTGLFALLCCSFNFFPVVQDMSSSVYLSVLNRQILIFGLINALVFLIYNFSSTNKNDAAVSNRDIYDEYVSFSSRLKTPSDEEKEKPLVVPAEPEVVFCDKQIVHCENVGNAVVEENLVPDDAVIDITEEKRFMRTRSDKYVVEKKKRSQRPVLRRSETEINGREIVAVAGGGDRRYRKSIKDMNNEEFRLTIENFIASKRKSLRDENFAVSIEDEEKEETFTAVKYE